MTAICSSTFFDQPPTLRESTSTVSGCTPFGRVNTWREEAGATLFEAMKAAGHSKPDTFWLYTITDQEREHEHVRLIWDRVTG